MAGCQNDRVGAGKHSGARRAPVKRARPRGGTLLLAAGVTFCVIAWGYLVTAAIDFGATAREGQSGAWLFLALACLGAAACLFAGLLIGVRLLRALGLIAAAEPRGVVEPPPPRVAGGRRAKR